MKVNQEIFEYYCQVEEGKPFATLEKKPANRQDLFNSLLEKGLPTFAKFLKLEKTELVHNEAPDKNLINRFVEKLNPVGKNLTQKPMPGHGSF